MLSGSTPCRRRPSRAPSTRRTTMLSLNRLAAVDRQAQLDIGVDRVETAILQLVGLQLVGDPDAPPLVAAQVHHGAETGLGDHAQGRVQLGAAVTPPGPEHVPGEALAVHP